MFKISDKVHRISYIFYKICKQYIRCLIYLLRYLTFRINSKTACHFTGTLLLGILDFWINTK